MEVGRCQVVITSCKGFTLIEVMIALTIFTIGLLGITGMLLIGETGIATGNRSLSAVQITRAQMEQLKGDSTIEAGSGECTGLFSTDIECHWEVKGDAPSAGLYEIEVKASLNEGERKRELVLNAIKFIK